MNENLIQRMERERTERLRKIKKPVDLEVAKWADFIRANTPAAPVETSVSTQSNSVYQSPAQALRDAFMGPDPKQSPNDRRNAPLNGDMKSLIAGYIGSQPSNASHDPSDNRWQ
ncbi:hypothetical protein nbrc107696_23960 [Gordonia spumicola]|uniref:Uncharacterized protein n=1 Tax=Gordonia spumicola TaxID=589161 RepID=A0A7I9VA53_9ACTN|nr:hypothetical protein [Gordonia spumicola]GEE01950.1 hypothetical protein nbrc107696_23960 [Gordonia spumicola]